jgi:hypothetical protein
MLAAILEIVGSPTPVRKPVFPTPTKFTHFLIL